MALGALLAVIAGCGDTDGGNDGGSSGGGPMGERCLNPGMTMTGCICDNGAQGSRRCTDDAVWTECACPEPMQSGECREGMLYVCDPCEGQADAGNRVRECIDGGVDCSC